jgi:hypothetical protein
MRSDIIFYQVSNNCYSNLSNVAAPQMQTDAGFSSWSLSPCFYALEQIAGPNDLRERWMCFIEIV